jgi:hypothetical protein
MSLSIMIAVTLSGASAFQSLFFSIRGVPLVLVLPLGVKSQLNLVFYENYFSNTSFLLGKALNRGIYKVFLNKL